MKLGVFDSGLGGLLITKTIRARLPDIDLLYYGDTLHLPYGNRSEEAIFEYTRRCMNFMFEQNCMLIVIACNTASAAALRKLQQEWLSQHWPSRNIIGVVVPTLEEALSRGYKKLGLIGTNYIIQSNIYEEELIKLSPDIRISQKATPLLVPIIEHDGLNWAEEILEHYLKDIIEDGAQCLMLGCTHYPFLKDQISKIWGQEKDIISQDEIIPEKLADYLERHPEYAEKISKNGQAEFYVSDMTESYKRAAQQIYGSAIEIKKEIAKP